MAYRPTAGPFLAASTADLVDFLRSRGHGPLLDCLQEPSAYLQNGKVNFAAIARLLGVSGARVVARWAEMVRDAKEQADGVKAASLADAFSSHKGRIPEPLPPLVPGPVERG